jgi:hypothetical protein
MAHDHVEQPFRDLLNDFINECATESVNAEVHHREDRWTCSVCGRHARDRFKLAQCEESHGPDPFVEDWRAEEAALDRLLESVQREEE